MDYQIFRVINNLAGQNEFLDQVGIFFADVFLYVFLAGVGLMWFSEKLRANVYAAFASVLVSRGVAVEIIKHLVARPRPFETNDVHQLVIEEEVKQSFPSGHAVMYFSLAFAFWGTRWFWPFFTLALLGSLSRVFVGVHYPLDILASLIIAAIIAWPIRKIAIKKLPNQEL
jgi:undecaprenyl-diphosphatase